MREPDGPIGRQELLDLAVSVARLAAGFVHGRRLADQAGQVDTKSTDTDLVTATDREAERLIAGELRRARPHDALLGEETGAHGPDSPARVRWVVDPIDGTVNYVYGLRHYAVSIAAEVDGEVVAGVVHNAATGEEWTAIAGGGAWRDGRRIPVRAGSDGFGDGAPDLAHTLVGTGFGYAAARREHQARVLVGVLPVVRDIRRFGSAAIDLCLAAEGRVDAYFEKGLNAWDHAAGGLVAAEAGLIVSGLRGEPPGPRMVLAAPPAVHGPLHDLLVGLDADGGP